MRSRLQRGFAIILASVIALGSTGNAEVLLDTKDMLTAECAVQEALCTENTLPEELEDADEQETSVEMKKGAAEETQKEMPAEPETEEKQEETSAEPETEETQKETSAESETEETQKETSAESETEETQKEMPAEPETEETQEETSAESETEEIQEETAESEASEETEEVTEPEAPEETEEVTEPEAPEETEDIAESETSTTPEDPAELETSESEEGSEETEMPEEGIELLTEVIEEELEQKQLNANDSYNLALSIAVNQNVTDSLVNNSDVNWYKFTIGSTGYVSLNFTHPYIESGSSYWRIWLYNAEQREIVRYDASGNRTNQTWGNIGLPSGTYYVKVSDYNYSSASYGLKVNYTASGAWEKEFNETYDQANAIAVNQVVYGSMRNGEDADWYRFTVSENGYSSLQFTHPYIESGSSYWRLWLYNEEQRELVNYHSAGNKTEQTYGEIGLPPGTYYVKVGDYNFSEVNYSLKVNFTASEAWEKEFNDTYDCADTIGINSTVKGSIKNSSDDDWYQFTLEEAGYLSLDFSHAYIESGNAYWRLWLYQEDQRELASYYSAGNKKQQKTGNIGLDPGTYYLKISDYNYSDATYSFKINFTASGIWEKEFNETCDSANKIRVNSTVKGSMRNSDDHDWYEFSIAEDGYISLSFAHSYIESGSAYWQIWLYNADQMELSRYSVPGNQTKQSWGNIGVPAGTYYIKISDYNYSDANYSLKVNFTASDNWEKEFNDSFEQANTVKVNRTVKGSMRQDGDADWYKFTFSRGKYAALTFSHPHINSGATYWQARLYDSSMKEIAVYSFCGDVTEQTQDKIYLSAGTYYVKITDYYYSDANYALKILDHDHTYVRTVRKATLSKNGKITKKCSVCGASKSSVIYYPKKVKLSSVSYTYNGKTRKPTVAVYDSKGKKISSSYYKVSYSSGCKRVGTYRVRVTFRTNYSGSIVQTFDIKPKGTSISGLTAGTGKFKVTLNKQTQQTSGYQIKYSASSKFTNAKYKYITKNTTTSATVSGLSRNKKYYVKVRIYKTVDGKKFYSGWSSAKSVRTK